MYTNLHRLRNPNGCLNSNKHQCLLFWVIIHYHVSTEPESFIAIHGSLQLEKFLYYQEDDKHVNVIHMI